MFEKLQKAMAAVLHKVNRHDLIHVAERGIERAVNSAIVPRSSLPTAEIELRAPGPNAAIHDYAAFEIMVSLRAYARRTHRGYAISDTIGFKVNLPHRHSFQPDAAFYTGNLSMRTHEAAPVFAADVRRQHDYGPRAEQQLAARRADYFAVGTLVVWDVDLLSEEVVRVYRSTNPDERTVYGCGHSAEAEPALPGWCLLVDYLFPSDEPPPRPAADECYAMGDYSQP